MSRRGFALIMILAGIVPAGSVSVRAAVWPEETYMAPGSLDQDDMCVWIHPTDPSLSTVITSDKESNELYVYDLDGNVLQTLPGAEPGNIDVRYGFQLGGQCVDIVALNERDDNNIKVYAVDPSTRQLTRVDNGSINTGPNLGFTLYKHRPDAMLYGYTGPLSGLIKQYRLVELIDGTVGGVATGWEFDHGEVEGMVGDDETGYVYLGESLVGIWRVNAMDDMDEELIAQVGDSSGLTADVEGVTLYHSANGTGYIIASSQGADKYTIVDRMPPHKPVGEFTVEGAGMTDGIDVVSIPLNGTYPMGMFVFHNGEDCCPVQSVKWEDIALEVGLAIDTASWDPRETCGPYISVSRTELSWTPAAQAIGYDVIRGDLASLSLFNGDYFIATRECLADDLVETTLPYADIPLPTFGDWYLIRAIRPLGNLSYDSFGASQVAPRDAGIEATPASCP